MSENEKYNGYSNKPTWAILLWAYNDESDVSKWHDNQGRKALDSTFGDKQEASWALVGILKAHYAAHDPLNQAHKKAGIYPELLGYALAMIDWNEVAEYIVEGIFEDWKADNPDDDDDDENFDWENEMDAHFDNPDDDKDD